MSTIHDDLVLGPELAGTLMTPEEFDAAEDWDELYVYELIHGVLIVSPLPAIGERAPNDLLGHLLRTYRDQHPQGAALDYTVAEHSVRTRRNRRRADRVIWAGLGRVPDPVRDLPTIIVEFVSRGRRNRRRDYKAKRSEYLRAGVSEYWIIDRFRREMTVVRSRAGAPEELVLAAQDTYTTPLLPGFELLLARLFGESDLFASTTEDAGDDGD
jgi:Uma2 family endonuclease